MASFVSTKTIFVSGPKRTKKLNSHLTLLHSSWLRLWVYVMPRICFYFSHTNQVQRWCKTVTTCNTLSDKNTMEPRTGLPWYTVRRRLIGPLTCLTQTWLSWFHCGVPLILLIQCTVARNNCSPTLIFLFKKLLSDCT